MPKILLIAAIAFAACSSKKPPQSEGPQAVKAVEPEDQASVAPLPAESAQPDPVKKVTVEFHVMSQCPYAVKVQETIKTVLDEMGEYIDFKQHFIATRNTDGSFK